MCCQKVLEQLGVLGDLRAVREGPAVHQHMVSQLRALCKCWAAGHLVWGPLLAYAYIVGHPIMMQVSEDPLQEAGAFSGCVCLSLRTLGARTFPVIDYFWKQADVLTSDVVMSGAGP